MNTKSNQSQQTLTIDYFQKLNANRSQTIVNTFLLERTIFQLLRNYPDVFLYNEQQLYDGKSRSANFILENGLLLGQGAYGNVYSTINPNNNQPAALKVQENCDFDQIIQQAEEFKMQKKIANNFPECIIQIQNKIVISQKYMNTYRMYAYLDLGLGNLKEYLLKLKKFSDLQFNNLFDSILDSIIKIHSLQIAHGDIKLENIINTTNNGWVLADFGCAIQYSTPYGEYPIVGTKAYLKKMQREALQNNIHRIKMNIFKKDIFAFQLAMLQIIYPEESIYNLQQILDQQLKVHPKIDSLYNKDYFSIKQKFYQIKFIRSPYIQESILPKEDIKMDINFKLNYYENMYQQIKSLPFQSIMIFWIQQFLNISLFNFANESERVKQLTIMDSFIDKYSASVSAEEIFEEISFGNLTKLEYDLYQDVLEKKGQKMLQLMLCQGYQTVQVEIDCNLKLQEAELLYIIGEMDQAKIAINSIQNELELESDELLLKFICLKSRLNNQWLQTRDEIILYLINYKNIYQVLNEWKFIFMDSMWFSKSLNIMNFIYHRDYNQVLDFAYLIGSKNVPNLPAILKLKNSNIQQPLAFSTQQQNYNSAQDLIEQNDIKDFLQNSHFDKYAVFYQVWIYFDTFQFKQIDQLFIEEFIKYIDQNLKDYYFNWIIYDFYAQFLTESSQYSLAKYYFSKAYQIIQNDCIYNQLILLSHLFQLQIHENNLECIDSFTQIINHLNQMPKTKITQFLYVTQFCLVEQMLQTKPQLNLGDFLDQAKLLLITSLKEVNQVFNYFKEKQFAIKNNDFFALKQLMWEELPKLQDATGQENEHEILEGFHKLIMMLENQNIELENDTRYTSRLIQLFIIFNSIGYDQEKFPFQIVDAAFYFYARTCHKQGEERKLEEAKELFMFFHANKNWFF